MKGPARVMVDGWNVNLVFNGASNRLKFFVRGGKMLFMVEARCDGANGTHDYAGGAMSYGLYIPWDIKRIAPNSTESSVFGSWFIELREEEGYRNVGPAVYGIHGGGLERPNYSLVPGGKPYKCLRLKNEDMELVASKLEPYFMFEKHLAVSIYK